MTRHHRLSEWLPLALFSVVATLSIIMIHPVEALLSQAQYCIPMPSSHPMFSKKNVAPIKADMGDSIPVNVAAAGTGSNECYVDRVEMNLTFPSYLDLMDCNVGEFVVSESFSCGDAKFCVKLYPRGGGHSRGSSAVASPSGKREESQQGFGMSYKILPMIKPNQDAFRNQRVGIYLQYLGSSRDSTDAVDATFALRLKGNQRVDRKFDLEWRAGVRFVPPDQKTELARGRANDFGSHLMQTPLLQEFMGISDDRLDEAVPLKATVEVVIHDTMREMSIHNDMVENSDDKLDEEDESISFFAALAKDIRTPPGRESRRELHDGKRVRVGKIVVPILNKLSQRPKMFETGAYPGVEYRILRIIDPQTGMERFTSCPGCDYEIRPIYPLVAQLERTWPVRVNESDIPRLYTTNMYNALAAAGSLLTAISGLGAAFLVSQAVSLFFIPSRSMDPTLQVGDVLLVDKLSPRLLKNREPGEIVLFSPPKELQNIVAANGGKLTNRDLFVKRIAARGGDKVSVDSSGGVQINGKTPTGRRDICEAEPLRLIEKYVKTKDTTLGQDEVFVMGDCSSVSIDSRVWGPLPSFEIVGKPMIRLWPLDRVGPLPTLQPLSTASQSWSD